MGKKKPPPPEEHEASGESAPMWVLSYADMITCCMCVFVMMVAMATFSDEKIKQAMHSIRNVGILSGGGSILPGSKVSGSAVDVMSGTAGEQIKTTLERLNTSFETVAREEEKVTATYLPTERAVVIRLPDGILFESGSYVLEEEAYPILREIAYQIIGLPGFEIQIAGHSDSGATSYESNWLLAARRAATVLEYLLEVDFEGQMIPQSSMSIISYGSTRPVKDNSIPENRAQNRRVEIILREPK